MNYIKMVYYYKRKIPSIDDIVVARVDKISPLGIDVSLIEYNDIKGFINCGEVSRKKRVNLNKLLTVGKDILLNVIQLLFIKIITDMFTDLIDIGPSKYFVNGKLNIIKILLLIFIKWIKKNIKLVLL